MDVKNLQQMYHCHGAPIMVPQKLSEGISNLKYFGL
jgi:hypothetical protein